METKVIKGDLLKESIFNEVKNEIAQLKAKYNNVPGIAFIGFTSFALAKYTIPLHVQLAKTAGFNVITELKSDDTTEEELCKLIGELNLNEQIHAIVLLQPLPAHLNPIRIINLIDPRKEVEGFHPEHMLGTLIPDLQTNNYPMCLPNAMIELFKDAGVQFKKDQEWVFVIDDEFIDNTLTNMVVKTAAARAVPHDCVVSMINKNSTKLVDYCKKADILIVVTKSPEYIQPEWLKPGVCIVDVYSNLVREVPSKQDPAKMVPVIRGGINVNAVQNIANFVIPVPGGVVEVVLPMLLRNALTSFKRTLLH